MAIDVMQAFQNGVSACYSPTQMQALFDAYCYPCAQDSSGASSCFKLLPSETPPSQFPLLGWSNQQPNPTDCPFLGVVVDCTLWLAPNDVSCNFLDPSIWVKIGGFVAAPKAQFIYQTLTPLLLTPNDQWYQLPLGAQDFNSMEDKLEAIGDTIVLSPGNYVIESRCSFHMNQGATETAAYTRLFNLTGGVEVKRSNKIRISGVSGASGQNVVVHTVENYFRARVAPTVITTYQIEHSTSGADPGDFKITAGNNELYIERDN